MMQLKYGVIPLANNRVKILQYGIRDNEQLLLGETVIADRPKYAYIHKLKYTPIYDTSASFLGFIKTHFKKPFVCSNPVVLNNFARLNNNAVARV